jgi:hypothetical protein
MQLPIFTGAELVKKMAALKINTASRKHYRHVPAIEFTSDTEPDEDGASYCG